jgi:hypothetical protein
MKRLQYSLMNQSASSSKREPLPIQPI